MISYEPTNISIEIVRLKTVTTALGGSISVLDEEKSTPKKEVFKRYACPLSVARAFIQRHKKVTKYLVPVLTAIVRYEDKIICLERHPLGTFGQLEDIGLDGQIKRWNPDSQLNIDRYINPLVMRAGREWFFDGRYIYCFHNIDIDQVINNADYISKDGKFRKVDCIAMDTQELHNADKIQPLDRTCVAYVATNGQYGISPPIWKDLMNIGSSKLNFDGGEDEVGSVTHNFDLIDDKMSVNLNFALSAGKAIGNLFGYDHVEPLQLPRLMIELHTVNLPNVPKQVKATYDIGLSFTHALAWMLGLLNKADSLDSYIVMRATMKYLTSKGIYRNDSFKVQNVFKDGLQVSDVQLMSLDEIMETKDYSRMSLASLIKKAKTSMKRQQQDDGISMISGLSID